MINPSLLKQRPIAAMAAIGISALAFPALAKDVANGGKGYADGADGADGGINGAGGAGALDGWTGTLGAGLSLNQGNSETTLFNAELVANKKWGVHEILLGAEALYGEVDGETTNELLHGSGQYNRLVTERMYLGLLGDALHDELADLDYRFSAYPLVGFYLIKDEVKSLVLEAGPGYVWEEQGGVKNDYAAARVAERFTYQLNEKTLLWQSVEATSELEDFDNYQLAAEIGLETQIAGNWKLRALVRNTYDAIVPAGIDDNDLTFITALAYGFGGTEETTLEDLKDAQAALVVTNEWTSTALLGLTATGGNSDTLLATANVLTSKAWDDNTIALELGGTYGEVGDNVSAQSVTAGVDYRKIFNDPFYFGLSGSGLHDDLAQVDYRLQASPALGVFLVNNASTVLTVEAGPAYVWEEVAGISDDYVAARAGQRLDHKLAANLSIWEELAWLGDIDDFSNWIINAEVGFEVALSSALSLKTFAQTTFDNEVPTGLDDNDIRVVSALSYTF